MIPDSDIITLRVESRNKYFLISLDGRSEIFPAGIELKMSKADYTTKSSSAITILFIRRFGKN